MSASIIAACVIGGIVLIIAIGIIIALKNNRFRAYINNRFARKKYRSSIYTNSRSSIITRNPALNLIPQVYSLNTYNSREPSASV
jgi:hypothetical protein